MATGSFPECTLGAAEWLRSSFCGGDGCVEIWRRSSFCADHTCVETAQPDAGTVAVRDSKDPDGPILRFTRAEWDAFLAGVRAGEFD